MFLKNYKGNPEELSLNFTVTDECAYPARSNPYPTNGTFYLLDFGEVVVTNLGQNGADRPVTADNRYAYILMVAHHRLKTQIRKQSDAFMEGLSDIIDPKWLRCVPFRDSTKGCVIDEVMWTGCSTSRNFKC
jgi:ubiquitin-protein ligase E3 C